MASIILGERLNRQCYSIVIRFFTCFLECQIFRKVAKQLVKQRSNSLLILLFNIIGMQSINQDFLGNPEYGNIALLTQSGIIRRIIFTMLKADKLGLSRCISFDDKRNVDWSKLRDIGDDDNTSAIILYLESIKDGRAMMHVAKKITRKKPIIVFKAGKSEAGARGVLSHTGSLSGSDLICQGAFKQAGMIRACSLEQVIDMSKALVYFRIMKGSNVVIISNGGGLGIICSDVCIDSGLEVPKLDGPLQRALDCELVTHGAIANPIDLTALATVSSYERTLKLLLESKRYNAIILVVTPTPMLRIEKFAESVEKLLSKYKIPIVLCAVGSVKFIETLRESSKNRIPIYTQPDRAVSGVLALALYEKILNRKPNNF